MSINEHMNVLPAVELLGLARSRGLDVRTVGDRLIVRGSPDADQQLVQALLSRKKELLHLLQPESESAAAAGSPRPNSGAVLECQGNLVRLAGLNGWLSVADLLPCGTCGGTRFRVAPQRLVCSHCLVLRADEKGAPEVDITVIQGQVRLEAGAPPNDRLENAFGSNAVTSGQLWKLRCTRVR